MHKTGETSRGQPKISEDMVYSDPILELSLLVNNLCVSHFVWKLSSWRQCNSWSLKAFQELLHKI